MLASRHLLGGRYRPREVVGEGGMAIVYAARDELLDRDVAVKVLRPAQAADADFVRRFRREARHAAQLHHPNVVTIHDLGTDASTGADYIVMELVDGPSLAELLANGQRLPLEEALRIAIETADAIQAAHDAGIVHRDVKPGNILIAPDGAVRVTDFGIARAAGDGNATTAGLVVGSPEYVSPEQVMGESVTPAADIYSLGVVLYEMTTGRRPFEGPSAAAIALQRLRVDPPAPASVGPVPPALDAIIRRAMARDPANRFGSAVELADALDDVRIALAGARRNQPSRSAAEETQWIAVPTTIADPIDPDLPQVEDDAARPLAGSGVARSSTPSSSAVPPERPQPVRVEHARDATDEESPRRRRAVPLVVALLAVALAVIGVARLLAMDDGRGNVVPGPAGAVASAPATAGPPVAVASPSDSPAATPTRTVAPTPTATARATARPTPRPTPAPTPRPAVAAGPADTVRTFYALVARHDFDAAASLWSASMRERYPPDQYIDGRFASTTAITVRRAETTSRTSRTARVAVDLVEERSDGSTRHWIGSWDLIRVSGRWLMDQPHF